MNSTMPNDSATCVCACEREKGTFLTNLLSFKGTVLLEHKRNRRGKGFEVSNQKGTFIFLKF